MKFFKILLLTGALLTLVVFHAVAEPILQPGQWSVAKANEWYAAQPWIVGCNFLPSTAVNDVEMWQSQTFDPATIDKELALAHQWGLNSVRVFLNYVVWEAEPEVFKKNFAAFLDLCEKHKITAMPILFDDCNFSGNVAKVGKQQNPVPGVHNSGWVSSPPIALMQDKSTWPKLKAYVQDMVKTFGNDKRIIIWDLLNESGHTDLVKATFAWAREMKPTQPLTTCLWADVEHHQWLIDNSDIVSFHGYGNEGELKRVIERCGGSGRPVACTEWLHRQSGNTPQSILPLFKKHRVAAYNWGLVEGRTQTYFHWGSKKDAPKPDIWQHDLIRADGTPYRPAEYRYFRYMILGDEDFLLPGQWPVEKANEWYAKQPWIVGCNFLPSTAINTIEMWQSESFDPQTIDRELALARQWGLNSVRVFIHYVVWEAEPEALKKNFAAFLDIAEKHGISVMPVLFDDCDFSGGTVIPQVGKQPDMIPGAYAHAWVASPHPAAWNNPDSLEKLKTYVQDMVKTFGNDKRIILWDLYNEPGNRGRDKDKNLFTQIQSTFAWAREMKPTQPLTSGLWDDFNSEKSQLLLDISDIISFHGYDKEVGLKAKIKRCTEAGRPIACTEWLCRQNGSTPRSILPLLKEHKVAAYHWGLVEGRTQTFLHWGSKAGTPKPAVWQHDLIQADGTPYKKSELHYFRHMILGEEDLSESVLLPTSKDKPLTWKFTESKPADNWFETDFIDTDWKTGNAPFGTEEPPYGRHPATKWTSGNLWLRTTFVLTEKQLERPGDVLFRVHFDEDAVVFVNGKIAAELPGYNADYAEFEMTAEAVATLRPGKNAIAVSVQNKGGGQYFDIGIVKMAP